MKRFVELDGLRGIAAFAVVLTHYMGAFNSRFPDAPAPFYDFPEGAFGVQLFFLISGFVILMSARRAKRPSDFVISRFSRLYPAYWASLLLAVAVVMVVPVPGTEVSPLIFLANLTMVQRWFLAPNINDAYWTLAIEMQFYVLVFLLLLVTKCRLTDKVLTWVASIWLVVSVAVSIWAAPWSMGVDPQNVILPVRIVLNVTLAEFGPLFIAGMFAFLSREAGRLYALAPVAGIIAVANAFLLHGWRYGLIVAIVVVGFAVVMWRRKTAVLQVKPVAWLGKISYSLYITHSIIGFALISLLWPVIGRDVSIFVVAAIALVLAWAFWWLFENKASHALRGWLLSVRGRSDARRASRSSHAPAVRG